MKKTALVFIVVFCVQTLSGAATLWRDRNIYKSGENLKVGDALTVMIDDITNLQFTMTSNSRSSSEVTSNPDVNITAFLPKVSMDKKTTAQDKSELNSKGRLTLSIAVQITARANDGTYAIRGIKEYSFSGVANRFEVTGTVDPALVNGRSVKSGDIINFRLQIATSKAGLNMDVRRPPLAADQTPKAELTNEEKQRIIIDYINRMLNELTR